jgi:predicted aspartyl protease
MRETAVPTTAIRYMSEYAIYNLIWIEIRLKLKLVPATAMIDTGASGSVITRDVAQRLGLQPVGVSLVHTASGTNVQTPMYAVRLTLSPTVNFETTASEAESIRAQGLDALIGRDVLSQAVLVYIGYMNQFTIAI